MSVLLCKMPVPAKRRERRRGGVRKVILAAHWKQLAVCRDSVSMTLGQDAAAVYSRIGMMHFEGQVSLHTCGQYPTSRYLSGTWSRLYRHTHAETSPCLRRRRSNGISSSLWQRAAQLNDLGIFKAHSPEPKADEVVPRYLIEHALVQ